MPVNPVLLNGLGSAAPRFTDWTILAEFLDCVREVEIDPGSLDLVLYSNAKRLLQLNECPLTGRVV